MENKNEEKDLKNLKKKKNSVLVLEFHTVLNMKGHTRSQIDLKSSQRPVVRGLRLNQGRR